VQTELTGSAVGLAASRFTSGYLGKLAELDPLHIAALLWIAILAACVARIDFHPGPSDVTRPRKLFALTVLLISAVLGPAATIFTGLQVLTEFNLYEAVMRYTQTTFLLPLIGLPVLGASALWQRRPRLAVAVIGAVAALSIAVSLSQIRVPAIPLHRHQPEIVKFVDSIAKTNQLGDGYAGYWQARLITLLSTEGVRALPVDSNGSPLLWVANERWFEESYSDRGRAPGISFVVLDDPAMPVSRTAVIGKLGPPAQEVAGESATLMIYRQRSEPSAPERF
jgi:hypothetical protein